MVAYERLKSELSQIVDLVESLPEQYRERSFELLVSRLLSDIGPEEGHEERHDEPTKEPEVDRSKKLSLPAKVRTFMSRHSITEDQLKTLLLIENGEVHFIREPEGTRVATGQIQWSLLLALRAALLGGDLAVDPEAVRSVTIDKGLYDKSNFAGNFRKTGNAALFQQIPEPQGPVVKLSSAGEKKLADLITSLTATT
jgi:hypothetical protein